MLTQQDRQTAKRVRLIEAARALMVERGLVGATTREIARRAGVAEGTIYRYFDDKYDLCLAVVRERMAALQQRLGPGSERRPPRRVLAEVVSESMKLFSELIPIFSGVIGHPDLAELHRRRQGRPGPMAAIRALAAYLEAAQRAGRIGPGADPLMLARVIAGTVFHHVYLSLAFGEEALEPRGRAFVEGLVDTVLAAAGKGRS